MVIKPWGYQLWENIRNVLDRMFKETGHVNAYFPLFIPLSFMEKEAEHVQGFAKECAVVTHHRLEEGEDGRLVPAAPLEEPFIVRPTSETIIGATFARWVQSYRDLPILINQWANIVRWEMRTRMFLRTTEFLWQEGHTVHETRDEAWEETKKILAIYKKFAQEYMAMPVMTGEKTESEKFPGAENTLCIEAMMQDRKGLQAGTSHFLGQNFSKASEIQFQSREGKLEYAWTTSWGVSTRLIGGLIMVHGDDNGMIMPPRLAPAHVVILPVLKDEKQKDRILTYCDGLAESLRRRKYDERNVVVEIDKREMNAGEKNWNWIKKGIPLRLEIGMKEIKGDTLFVARRDQSPKDRYHINRSQFIERIKDILQEIQNNLFEKARLLLDQNTRLIDNYDDFCQFFTPVHKRKPEIHGGFALSHWCGETKCEEKIKDDLMVTIRCIPFDYKKYGRGKCILCGKQSEGRIVFGKSY